MDYLCVRILKLEALREHRPPWPRQITTPIIIINTVSVMFDNYDWRMMLKLLGVSSYRRRIKADRRLKGGAQTMYELVG